MAARHAVFCAGGQASRLAVAAGAPQDPRIVPFRGQYLSLRPHARGLVNGLIYPVPDPDLPFLGVHLTRHISGDVLLGLGDARRRPPLPVARRRAALAGHVAGGAALLAHRACTSCGWPPAGARSSPPARATCPSCGPRTSRAARPACARRRSAATARWSTTSSSPRPDATLHVRNAPSPAATSSLALGELIADRALAFAE